MQEEWWYSSGDAREGPVSVEALRTLLLERKVHESTLVWKEGRDSWNPILAIPELNQFLKAVPPELPSPSTPEHLLALSPAGPWRRFFARTVDMSLIAVPISFGIAYWIANISQDFALWMQHPFAGYAFAWAILPLALLVEVGVVAVFGNTLGKALLGIKIATIDAQRLKAAQYLQRQIGVYWYGFCTGLPLVPLFTMWRQRGRLKAGKQTSYDDGRFYVKAKNMSVLRAFFAAIVVFGVFSANIALQNMSNSSVRTYYGGTKWLNPETGESVVVPGGWVYEKEMDDDGQPLHIFAGPKHGVYVMFAKEELSPDLELDAYVDALSESLSENIKLATPGQRISVGGRPAVNLSGAMVAGIHQRVQVTVVKQEQNFWRVVAIAVSDQDPAGEHPMELQNVLFDSID